MESLLHLANQMKERCEKPRPPRKRFFFISIARQNEEATKNQVASRLIPMSFSDKS